MKSAPKAIIYDGSCPMCQAYTKGFVKWGVLADEHRIAFSELQPDQARRYLDVNRSRHEIPLVDLGGGETLYGVEALVYLLSQRIPFIEKAMQNPLVFNLIKKLYSFISYNRRVITATSSANQDIDCAPDFRLSHRLHFIIFSALTSSLVAWRFGVSVGYYFSSLVGKAIGISYLTGCCILFLAVACVLKSQKRMEYMGQLAMLLLIGTLALLPGLALTTLTHQPVWLLGSAVVSLVLLYTESVRRVRYIQTLPGS